jgi:PAS domain S-box-containing protein
MKLAPIPEKEIERIAELMKYCILDTSPDDTFDQITKLAASICNTKIAFVSLIDTNRQWFKSRFGLDTIETPRDISFCGHAIMGDEIFIVQNSDLDPRFCDNPLVTGDPLVKFYAGAPLITPSGHRIGTLCVIDHVERSLTDSQKNILKSLSSHVINLLELKFKNHELKKIKDQYFKIQKMTKSGWWELDVLTSQTLWSDELYEIYQVPLGTPVNLIDGISFYAPHERERLGKLIQECIDKGEPYDSEFEFFDSKGNHKWVRSIGLAEKNDTGKVIKIYGTFKDITQYKLVEIKLWEKITETDTYVRALNKYAIVAKTDRHGVITYVNDVFVDISGYSKHELIGQNHRILNSGNHSKAFFIDMWKTISSGKQWRGEIKNKKKDGSFYWVDTTITPSFGITGEISEYIGIRYDISERKEIELKLKESEENHRLLFDQSEDAVMTLFPPSFKFNSGNPASIKLFGANDYNHFCSLGPWDVSPEFQSNGCPSIDEAKKMIGAAMSEGSISFEWDHQKLDGTVFPSTILLSRITSSNSVYLQATVRDISAKKIAEENLLKKTTELNKFFDLALNFVLITGLDGKICKSNSAWASFGYTGAELLSMRFTELIHPDDLKYTLKEFEKLKNGSPSIQFTNRLQIKSGEYKTLSWASSLDSLSGLIYAVGLDVTEQKKKEHVLNEISYIRAKFIEFGSKKKDFYNFLIKKLLRTTGSQYGFVAEVSENQEIKHLKYFDGQGNLWGNEKSQELLINSLNGLCRQVLDCGEVFLVKDARGFTISSDAFSEQVALTKILAIPILYAGKHIALLGFANSKGDYDKSLLTDLTPLYESIGEMINALQIDEQLENQKLIAIQTTKLASIGQLAAGVGHEINNPLAIISGQMLMAQNQLTLLGVTDPGIIDRFGRVASAVSRIENIVKGLRTFARSDENQISPFCFYELLLETIDLLHDMYSKEEVNLVLDTAKIPSTINGNRGRVQQVIVNLISNAKDATLGLEIRNINISLNTQDGFLRFSVKDNGSGIPDEIREKIFDPFFTTKEFNMGTGIGLSLVNTIIKEHNGKIELESSLGSGSMFTVIMPYDQNIQKTTKSSTAADGAQVVTKISRRILIVDDEEDLRDILTFILKKFCSNISTSSNITEAYQSFVDNKIELVISDIKMPGGDGFKLLDKIRQNTTCAQPKFIFISGGNDLTDKQSVLIKTQTNGLFSKPFQVKVITEKIKELFQVG